MQLRFFAWERSLSGVDVKFERSSTVALTRGLHVVRYASSAGAKDYPIAVVRPAAGFERSVEIVSAPGTPQGWLDKPGACLVVSAQGAARLEIGLRRSSPTGTLDASFQIDNLSGGRAEEETASAGAPSLTTATPREPAVPPLPAEKAKEAPPAPASGQRAALAVVGHVAMRGDVAVTENEWLAGPKSPAPIEGVSVRSTDRDRLSVEMQVLAVGAPQWSIWVGDGAFAGTRGRGLPLAGVRLRLVGAEASRVELSAEALFLGQMVQSKTGRQVEFASATGSDPLVGLKLGVHAVERPLGVQKNEGPAQDRGSRVRVFRPSAGEKGV